MIKEEIKHYKELEQLSCSPYDNDKYPVPSNFVYLSSEWKSIENIKTSVSLMT